MLTVYMDRERLSAKVRAELEWERRNEERRQRLGCMIDMLVNCDFPEHPVAVDEELYRFLEF